MLPICVKDRVEMRCQKNGQALIAYGSLYHGDVYACPVCDVQVIVGFAPEAIAHAYEPGWAATVQEESRWGAVMSLDPDVDDTVVEA